MTLEERMESGKLYNSADETLQAKQRAFNELVYDFNATRPSEIERRTELLHQIFAEVGEGTLPVAACIEAGLAGGSEYFLVEQDDTYGRDPFESLKISHDNLVKLGYGEWF